LFIAFSLGISAQAPQPPPPDQDPFVGMWKAAPVDPKKPLSAKDASYTRTITRQGEEVFWTSSGGNIDGIRHYSYRCDGKLYFTPANSKKSCVYTAPNRVEEMSCAPDGSQASYVVSEISAHGNEMRITSYKDKNHRKVVRVDLLIRVR
jgi:hypothetical protein